jgi:hypothetical protein
MRCSAVAILAATVLALAACNGGGNTPAAEPTSASPSVSATPSGTPTPAAAYKPADATGKAQNVPVPVLPAAAKAETKEGAIAFAGYWFKVLSYSYETGDLKLLESVTSQSCGPCEKAKKVISAWYEEGRWLVGGKISTPAIETTFSKGADTNYKVAVQAHQVPLTYVRADGTVSKTDPKGDDTGNLLLISYRDAAWHLNDVGNIVG